MAGLGFFKRRPELTTLIALECLLFIIVSYQVKVDERLSLLEKITLTVFGPVQELNQKAVSSVGSLLEERRSRAELERENNLLRSQLSQHEALRTLYRETELENQRLRDLLDMPTEDDWTQIAARVVGRSQRRNDYMITINRGARHGLRRDVGVYCPDGVVGIVWEVSGSYAKVITVNNPSTVIAAMVQDVRYQECYVSGLGDYRGVLKNFPAFETVQAGDLVLTSGLDRLFPKGLHIGRIVKGAPTNDMFQEVEIRFTADFSRLEEVVALIPNCVEEPDALE